MVDPQLSNICFTTSTINNTLTGSLTITNAVKSYTGYYWVRLPSEEIHYNKHFIGDFLFVKETHCVAIASAQIVNLLNDILLLLREFWRPVVI